MNAVIDMSAVSDRKELATTSQASSIIQVIERAARDPNIDIDKMERLLSMQERILGAHKEERFNAAMTAAQTEIGRVSADKENTQTHSWYASYAQLDRHLRPIYTKHGFALSFDEADSPKAEHVRVVCIVSHADGHSRPYHRDMPADGKGAKGGDVMTKTHAVGSAQQYGMRYLLKGIFNVAIGDDPDDDDGNGAGNTHETLSEEQIANLEAMITEVGADKVRFLRYIKCKSLSEILACNYTATVKMLEAKRAQS
jgi:hypothetical protein